MSDPPRAQVAVVDAGGRIAHAVSDGRVPWWSFTKTLIAACVLRLSEQGRLDLERDLAGRPYSPRQLLCHRAGLATYDGLAAYHQAVAAGERPWSDAELWERVGGDSLLHPPDGGWAYSNVGYLLLRRLIESACDAPLAEALRAVVLEPLGLRETRLAASPADMAATVFGAGRTYDPGWVFHGVLVGPVEEAALALQRLLAPGLLSERSRAMMLARHPLDPSLAAAPWVDPGYGLGLMAGTMRLPGDAPPLRVAGHSAGGPGSAGAVYLDRETGRVAAVFRDERETTSPETSAAQWLANGRD